MWQVLHALHQADLINPLMFRVTFTFLTLEMAATHVFWRAHSHSNTRWTAANGAESYKNTPSHTQCVRLCLDTERGTHAMSAWPVKRTHTFPCALDRPRSKRAYVCPPTPKRTPTHLICNLDTVIIGTHTHGRSASPSTPSLAETGG